ncbi:hypothetical protein [Sorangium sp. So ce145]|uniref:hypothetical protein n=1 Tax=Sorangium sp. So ce145 TaxID=3133285 RepID=UPI003F5D65AC
MKARALKRRHRLRLPGPAITGEVSRADVLAYLRATWWLGSSGHWLFRGAHAVPVPSRDDHTLESSPPSRRRSIAPPARRSERSMHGPLA